MSPTERKRIKEKKRREGMKKGFQELAKLIFLIDPDLKERATSRKKSMGMRLSSSTDESQILDRVDLVNIAVTTLARVYKDNEVHKMLISHLTRKTVKENQGESNGTSSRAS
jgi:predicted chitinase